MQTSICECREESQQAVEQVNTSLPKLCPVTQHHQPIQSNSIPVFTIKSIVDKLKIVAQTIIAVKTCLDGKTLAALMGILHSSNSETVKQDTNPAIHVSKQVSGQMSAYPSKDIKQP